MYVVLGWNRNSNMIKHILSLAFYTFPLSVKVEIYYFFIVATLSKAENLKMLEAIIKVTIYPLQTSLSEINSKSQK